MKSKNNFFAIQLRNILREKKITQAELAKKLGLTQTMISHWLNGDRNPTLNSLKKIADALKVSVSYLTDKREFISTEYKKMMKKENDDNLVVKLIENQNKLIEKINKIFDERITKIEKEISDLKKEINCNK